MKEQQKIISEVMYETFELAEVTGMLENAMNMHLQYVDISTSGETAAAVEHLYGVSAALGMLKAKALAIHNTLDRIPTSRDTA